MLKRAFAVAALGAAVALPVTTFAQPAGTNPPVSADANSESGASYRATDLLNQQVKGEDGQVIADIEDFVLDAQTNQVQYVVLSYGGAPEGQFVVVPFSAVHVHYENEAILVQTPLTVDVLKAAPTFAAAEWVSVIRRPNWYSDVNTYWTNAGVDIGVGPGVGVGGRGPGAAPGRGPGRGPNAGNLNPDRPGANANPNRPGANSDRPGAGANPDRPRANTNPDRPGATDTPDRPRAGANPDRPGAGANPDRPNAGSNPDRPGAGAPGAGDAPRTPGGPGPQNPGAGNPGAGAGAGGNAGAGASAGGAGAGAAAGAGAGAGAGAPNAGR